MWYWQRTHGMRMLKFQGTQFPDSLQQILLGWDEVAVTLWWSLHYFGDPRLVPCGRHKHQLVPEKEGYWCFKLDKGVKQEQMRLHISDKLHWPWPANKRSNHHMTILFSICLSYGLDLILISKPKMFFALAGK